jgi:hypothetical protein
MPILRLTRRHVARIAGMVILLIAAWLILRPASQRDRFGLDILYPGSTVIMREEGSSSTRLMVRSNASTDEVLTWYRAELDHRGFRYAGSARTPLTTEQFACSWQDDERILRLAFMDLNTLGSDFLDAHLDGATTLYRWSVLDRQGPGSDRPCNILLEGDPVP